MPLRRLSVARSVINSVLRRVDAYVDETLAGSDVREQMHAIEFQLNKNAANYIEGFLFGTEEALLYSLATKCNASGVIVEIGSWKGRSTVLLAKGSKAEQGVKIYAIDPHEGNPEDPRAAVILTFEVFKKNIVNAQAEDIVVPIVKPSEEANDFFEPCALIFVDGSHEPDNVKKDFVLWYPKLIEGGS